MKTTILSLCMALALSACGNQPVKTTQANAPSSAGIDQPTNPPAPQSAQQMFASKLDQTLAGSWREASNTARDQYRHPKQTLEFFGLKPGMRLIEITPGGGWYAEILAPLLKDDGQYIAAIAKPSKPTSEAAQNKTGLYAMFAANPAEYAAAKIVEFDRKAPVFGPSDSADMVVTFRNVHNWVMGNTAAAMFKAFFNVLKPGGVLGVAEHRATPGADLAKVKQSGYLPEDFVIKLATDAGFKLVGKSEINANPKDNHEHPKGVWTLPPSLQLGETDKAKYLAIGESDRMTLRFVKPGDDKIFNPSTDQGQAGAH